jgi:hypothetical protein
MLGGTLDIELGGQSGLRRKRKKVGCHVEKKGAGEMLEDWDFDELQCEAALQARGLREQKAAQHRLIFLDPIDQAGCEANR